MSGARGGGGTSADWRAQVQAALGTLFVLERELSAGPRSRVFVGTETALGRRVVLKMLIPEAPGTEEEAEFRREAITAARLHHPHIVPVFAIGTALGLPYYTMPFIDGESLRTRLDRDGALAPEPALRVFREIGSALAFAHDLGFVHRDVKPENIVLERATGRALLADFGIACPLGGSRRVTPAGTTVGTPVYMSPEQVDGLELDGRTDIYSLGLVLWEMLTGARPWVGDSLYDVMYRQKHESLPALDAYGVDVPRSVVVAIDRALQKDRKERWRSIRDFLAAVDVPVRTEVPAPGVAQQTRSDPSSAPDGGPRDAIFDRDAPSPRHEAASAPPAVSDSTTAPTVAVAVRRGIARPHVPATSSAHVSQPTEWPVDDQDGRTGSIGRWIVAACGALAVVTGIVAAMTVRHDIVRWTAAGDVTEQPGTAPSAHAAVDTVPMAVVGAALTPIETLPAVAPGRVPDAPAVPLSQAPLSVLGVRSHPAVAARVPPGSARLTPRDAPRARAATATLALEAYEGAVRASPPAGARDPGVPDTAVPVEPNAAVPAPAVAVRVRSVHPAPHP